MANEQDNRPTTGTESDISKSQSQQQPLDRASQDKETGEQRSQPETDEEKAGQPEELQGETATKQRTDIEGASFEAEKGEAESGFVGAEGQQDSSSELVQDKDEDEDEEGSKPDGQ
jgi:hypothetical protein